MISINKTKGIFISFLLGGAIGSAIALLYAPKSGKLLRSDISRKTNELIEEGKKKTYDSFNDAKEKAESTIESANDFLNTGKEKIVRKAEKVKDAFKAMYNAYNDERNDEGNENNESNTSFEDEGFTYGQIT
jgi:gas vesicle protein